MHPFDRQIQQMHNQEAFEQPIHCNYFKKHTHTHTQTEKLFDIASTRVLLNNTKLHNLQRLHAPSQLAEVKKIMKAKQHINCCDI